MYIIRNEGVPDGLLLTCFFNTIATDILVKCSVPLKVCMTLPGGGLRLQTLGGLAAQLFDSTLRT